MSDQTVGEATERVGFCQDCGKPLTRETVRTVGSGVFCEPCLETRLGYSGRPAAGYTPAPGYSAAPPAAGPGYVPGYVPPPPPYSAVNVPPVPPAGAVPVPTGSTPSPALAALLGIIPGVGAFYNGQFAKGFAHLIIFVALAALKDVSDVFGILVFAWICYQSIEAYHTARARRDGLPLPNPFGLNEIGERFGFGKNWGHLHPDPAATAAAQSAQAASNAAASAAGVAEQAAATAADAASVAAASASGSWGAPVSAGAPPAAYPQAGYGVPPANWAGYVSSAHFAGNATPPLGVPYAAPPSAASPVPPTGATGPWVPGSYENTFTGSAYGPGAVLPPARASRFPVGAIWLIAIGLLILVGDLSSQWRISGLWMLTLLLAGMAGWSATRKLGYLGGVDSVHDGNIRVVVCMLRGPVMLTTLAVLFGLQAAHVATLGQTWPGILIVFGLMLLLERTIGSGPVIPPYSAPAGAYVPYTAAAPAPPAPETSASHEGSSQSGDEGSQGGQR